jgi:hypothetical protein
MNFQSFFFSTLFRKGDGLFDWKCTTGGEGTKRAGFGTGSLIGLFGSSCLNQRIFIPPHRTIQMIHLL